MPPLSTEKVRPLCIWIVYRILMTLKGMDALEKKKSKHVVAPAINWLIATLHDAVAFGYTTEKAEQVGYQRELDAAVLAMREMHRRGIVVLPGGSVFRPVHPIKWNF